MARACVCVCVCVCVCGEAASHINYKSKQKRQRRQLEEESGYSQDTVLSHAGMIHNQNVTSTHASVSHHQAAVNSGLNQGASSHEAWVRMRSGGAPLDGREEGRQKSKWVIVLTPGPPA